MPVAENDGVWNGILDIGTTFLDCLQAGGGAGTYGVDYARSSRAASDSAPAAGREVDRCRWKDMRSTLKEEWTACQAKICAVHRRVVGFADRASSEMLNSRAGIHGAVERADGRAVHPTAYRAVPAIP